MASSARMISLWSAKAFSRNASWPSKWQSCSATKSRRIRRSTGNRYGADRADVRLSFRSRRGWPHDYSWIRLRRREEGHDQAAQFAPGKLLPDPSDDGPEVPKNRGMDESVHVFWNAGLF